jgi:hypothetical protein
MDLNCLTWVVSLVVAEQRRLASILIGHMGFYELRSAMEPLTWSHDLARWLGARGPQ